MLKLPHYASARRIFEREGLRGVVRRVWRRAGIPFLAAYRSVVPRSRPVLLAGVRVPMMFRPGEYGLARFFDLPAEVRSNDRYEAAAVIALRMHVRKGDRVVVVGGGYGVTVSIAAVLSGPRGQITCFEGGEAQVDTVRATVALNELEARVVHAFVGPCEHVYGALGAAVNVPPEGLPECDVLELDCEGAEMTILSRMTIRPLIVIVESHGLYGSRSSELAGMLVRLGYAVSDLGVAEPDGRLGARDAEQHALFQRE